MKHGQIISEVDEMWGTLKPNKNQLVSKIICVATMLTQMGKLMLEKAGENGEDLEGLVTSEWVTQNKTKPTGNDLNERLDKLETSLPEKVTAIFKSIMDMSLGDFKENYRKHTTNVCLIVSE